MEFTLWFIFYFDLYIFDFCVQAQFLIFDLVVFNQRIFVALYFLLKFGIWT